LLRTLWEAFPSALEPSLAEAAALMGHDHAYPHTDPHGIHTFTPELYEMFLEDIDAETAHGRVHFFHPLLPHWPFVYEEDGSLRTASSAPSYPDANPRDAWEKYSEQMVYTDTLLGIVFDELKREGLYDDSIVIVTGDHGLRRVHTDLSAPITVDDVVARVPLVIKAPRLKPGVSAFAENRPVREKVFYASASDSSRYWEYRLSGGQWTYLAEHMGAFPGADGDEAVRSRESGALPLAQE